MVKTVVARIVLERRQLGRNTGLGRIADFTWIETEKITMNLIQKIFLSGILALSVSAAQADIIYDNGGPDTASPNGQLINDNQLVADDFVLTTTTILTDGHFWTAEQQGAWDGSLVYAVFEDVGGQPGGFSQIVTLTLANPSDVTKTYIDTINVGGLTLDRYVYDFDFVDPIELATGTYWFALYLQLGTDPSPWIFWSTTTGQEGSALHGIAANDPTFNWVELTATPDVAFYLTGFTVPAPGTLLLLAIGLLAGRGWLRNGVTGPQ